MRRLLAMAACVLALGAMPATAAAPGDGTLAVVDGRGLVQLSARGTMIGKIAFGRITVTDPNPYDGRRPVVLGAERTTYRGRKVTIYSGRDIRFRASGGLIHVRFDGRGIQLSAVGRGRGMVEGMPDPAANDGFWSLNDEDYRSLPEILTGFQLVGPPASRD